MAETYTKRIEELAIRRHNLINELAHINSRLVIEYEQLMIEAGKGSVDIKSVAQVLHEADFRALRKAMPVLSNAKPIVEEPIDSSNVKPHIVGDPDADIDDKCCPKKIPEPTFEEKIAKIKQSERYLESSRTNQKNLESFKNKYANMSGEKKIKFKENNIPELTQKVKELSSKPPTNDPNSYVAREMDIEFYKSCLACLTSN